MENFINRHNRGKNEAAERGIVCGKGKGVKQRRIFGRWLPKVLS
jgi:hypothetical protein